jgi:hypothetical protein
VQSEHNKNIVTPNIFPLGLRLTMAVAAGTRFGTYEITGQLGRMRTAFGKAATVAVLLGAAALRSVAVGGEADAGQAGTATTAPDEIIVLGRIDELRRQLRRAEEAVYERFNEINSDDRFDIHCRMEPQIDSHIPVRVCVSNSWREQDANYGEDLLRHWRGEPGSIPEQYAAEQLRVQHLLKEEMRRLATEDEQLYQTVVRLADAQRAYAEATGGGPPRTLWRQVMPGPDGLPFGAQRMFEVRMSREPWNHPLTHRTFTIGDVSGEIRKLQLDCAQGSAPIEYQAGVDWTLPSGWGTCKLRVDAKRDTTFALYEFE